MQPESFTCNAIKEQIDGLSRKGFQSALRSGAIQEHVQECGDCRAYFEQAMAFSCHLDSWQVPEPKEDLCARVMTQIAQLERDRRSYPLMLLKLGVALLNVRLRVPAAAAAVLMAALVVSVTLNIRGIHSTKLAKQSFAVSDTLPVSSPPDNVSTAGYLHTDRTDQILSYMNSAALTPSAIVVLLGAPPFSAFDGAGVFLTATSAGTQNNNEKAVHR